MSKKYEKLKRLLLELFQLDQPDLDFGIYRIMHAKSAEVTKFLDQDLLPQVQAAFAGYKTADKAELEKELAKAIEQAQALGADPDALPKVQELRARLANEAIDVAGLESEVYDHLFSFFRRYYAEGDFLSKRVYKPGVYAIPYEGEEVKLHWANADQYYIKTSEYLRDYAFRLQPDHEKNPMRVHFRLVDAAEGEHGNVKAAEGKDRVFILKQEDFLALEDGPEGEELVLRFEYRPATLEDWPEGKTGAKPPKQKDLMDFAEARILDLAEHRTLKTENWHSLLAVPHVKTDGETADYSRLRVHLNRYAARNTFDYFIHKDLGGFLRRELDFYIKNEVMHLDDIEHETAPRVEQYLSKIKVIRKIAGKVIDFVAQIEDFQKTLWLKKKFVVETSWLVRLDMVPEHLLSEIANNDAQLGEWRELFKVKPNVGLNVPKRPEAAGSLVRLSSDLQLPSSLVVDTRNFSTRFTESLLDELPELAEWTDAVLINSENFQCLSLIQTLYRNKVPCIYIDPPYNTGDSEILYKNQYLKSSWLTLMASRLDVATRLLSEDPVLFIAIDDFEMVDLSELIDTSYPALRREMIIVNHHPQGGKAKTMAHTHEYMLACVRYDSDRTLVGRSSEDGVERRPFRRSGTAESNFRYGRPNSFYALLVDPATSDVVGLEPPPVGSGYPRSATEEGFLRVYPISANGDERVWRRSYESCKALVAAGKLVSTEGNTIYQLLASDERTSALFSNWVDPRYNAGTHGANLLRDIMGSQNSFAYPKSLHTVGDALYSADIEDGDVVLDFFGGSGTTGHAVVDLNREDGTRRRVILVEMGAHFENVLTPRMKRIAFTPEWKDGEPLRLPTPEEAERGPRLMKVIRLESYEDTLNNLELRRTEKQQTLLDHQHAQEADGLREQYLLKYMLDVETRGSQSLLNVSAFTDPTAYRLKVKRPGTDETREVNVDLLETFNWLIGLTVRHLAAPQAFTAKFKRDTEGRLTLSGRLKEDANGPFWYRTVTGATPDGRKTLVIWRKLSGVPEEDNLALDAWFQKQGYSSKDSEFDIIYVNGDNNLENLKTEEDLWKVRLIEDDFHRLMFDTTGVA